MQLFDRAEEFGTTFFDDTQNFKDLKIQQNGVSYNKAYSKVYRNAIIAMASGWLLESHFPSSHIVFGWLVRISLVTIVQWWQSLDRWIPFFAALAPVYLLIWSDIQYILLKLEMFMKILCHLHYTVSEIYSFDKFGSHSSNQKTNYIDLFVFICNQSTLNIFALATLHTTHHC